MPRVLMNDRTVAGLRTVGETYFDTKTTGLVLRVGARTKTWFFVYRNGGAPEWMKLGQYPAVGLATARDEALSLRHQIDIDGIDPAVERRQVPVEPAPAPKAFTFADFVPVFVGFQKGRKKTWRDDEAMIARHVQEPWGGLPLREITRTHVHELLDTVAGQGLTIGVNRLQALISRIFTVALDRNLIDAHPAARMIKRFDETPGTRVLDDAELRALWAGLDAHPGAASDAVRLRLLLGQRGEETAGLRWAEVDLTAATWALPPARTKNARPHVVPLPKTALALVKRRRAVVPDDEPRVFPGLTLQGDEHKAVAPLTGGAYEWKDLRRTVATRLADLGFSETVIGRVLNHAKYGVTGKHYNQHRYLDEIRDALTAWDVELQRVLSGAAKTRSRVLRMRRR